MKVKDVKERVQRAEYDIDPDAVAEAIVRRITVDTRALRRSSQGMPEAFEAAGISQLHA